MAAGFGLIPLSALAQGGEPPLDARAPHAAAAAASAASAGSAGQRVAAGGTNLDLVVVTGRRSGDADSLRATSSMIGKGEQDLRDIPQSVTVVTEKLLEDRRVDTVKEALHNTAGISFMAAEGGEEDIRLRGFSLTASGDLYIDGVRDPAFYDRDVFNFDRIEVMRGSASMVFGRGSTGGVVNQVNKVPFLSNATQVDATLGTAHYMRFTGDFNVKTGDAAALRVNVMKTDADNFGTGIDKMGIAPSLRFGVATSDEFLLSYFYLENDNGINYGIPWLQGGLVPINPRNNYAAASDYSAGSASYGTFQHVHRFANGSRWHTVVRSGGYERDLRASAVRFCIRSAANPACTPGPVTLANLSGTTTLRRGTNNKVQELKSTYVQSDVQASWTALGMTHEVLGGVDWAREEFNNYALVLPPGVTLDKNTPQPVVGTPNDGTSVDESLRSKVLNRNFVAKALGVYAQDLLEVVPHWKLLAGVRWDNFEGNYVSPTSTTLPAASRSDSLWSHRFGVLYQPNDQATVYASYGTSFNTSGDLYNYDAPGSRADPEKSRNIEIGTKLDLFEGRLSTRVSAFHSSKYNERNRDSPTGQPLTDFLLSGKRHAAGLELDFAGRITPRWEVYGSYAWIPFARIDEAAFGVDLAGEREGARPSLTPRHSGTIWSTYQVTSALRLGAGLNARSAQTPNRNPAGIVVPGYVTADVLAEYAFNDRVSFKFNVVNVTDELYADSIYTGHYIPGQARTLYVTMTARY